MAIYFRLRLIILPRIAQWHMSCNQHSRPPESSGLHWGTTYHAWCMSYWWLQVDSSAVWLQKATSCRGKPMSRISTFGENQSIDVGNSQRLPKEDNARINRVLATRPGFVKLIEKVRISRYFESAETDLHIADDACCIDYADTWSSKRVHSLSKSQSLDHSTTYYWCEETLKLDIGVSWASLRIMRIHPWVALQLKLQWVPATLHNTGWMNHCQVHHRCFEAIWILDPVDVTDSSSRIASRNDSLQWHVQSYGWRYVSFG